MMKQQPGFVPTELHRGIRGRTTLVNVGVCESAAALGRAFSSSEFQAPLAQYPYSAVAAPHLFEKVAVPGICVRLPSASLHLYGPFSRPAEAR